MNAIYFKKKISFLVKSMFSYNLVFLNKDIACFYKKKYCLTYPVDSLLSKSNFVSMLISRCFFINYNLPRFGLINRLDYLSIGILVFCRNFLSYKRLISFYKLGTVRKYYITIVTGIFPTFINSYCGFCPSNRRLIKRKGHIITIFKRVSYFTLGNNHYSLVLGITNTGKYQQIRKQLKLEGFGIISDNRNCKKKYFFLQFFMLKIPGLFIRIPFDFLFLKLIKKLCLYKKIYF
ncbi:pseudouridine synthase [Candidatus Vidania fulgoroideorum]